MTVHRVNLVRHVPDAEVVRDRDSAVLASVLEPSFVRTIGWEQVIVTLHVETGGPKYFREALS
jgi:hypothetical protein